VPRRKDDDRLHEGTSALGRDAMRCDAMRCDAMRCDAMRCDAMRCDAMRCDAMRCDAPLVLENEGIVSCFSDRERAQPHMCGKAMRQPI
jgi:hypothetical protein